MRNVSLMLQALDQLAGNAKIGKLLQLTVT